MRCRILIDALQNNVELGSKQSMNGKSGKWQRKDELHFRMFCSISLSKHL